MSKFFVETYDEARALFLEAVDAAGFRPMRVRIPNEDTPELFQDYALLRRDPKRLLIHVSGVHGVEGYVGSAVQRKILAGTFGEDGPSILFLHAFNPYGMAFYRRANAQNVDLNRNFRKGPAKPNPDYRLFDSYLNPRHRWQFYTGALQGFFQLKRIGKARASMAVAAGQVAFPDGSFYMGHHLQREVVHCQEILRAHGAEAERVTVIDVHSGLGEAGAEMLFVDADGEPESPTYFEKIFGRPVSHSDPAKGIYKNQGPLWDAFRDALPQAKLHYVLQEFGSRSPGEVLHALREENYEWHRRPKGALRPEKVKDMMLAAFCPDSPEWWRNVTEIGELRWRQAHDALRI